MASACWFPASARLDSASTSQYGKYAVKILEGVPGRRLRTGGRCVADMRKEWFRSNVGKLLLAGLLSFALVGALYAQWLAAERHRRAKAEPPTPHSQPAAPSTKSSDDMAGVVRGPGPAAPEPTPAPAPEDLGRQAASAAQPIQAGEPPKPEPKPPAAAENRPAASGAAERPAPSQPVVGENRAEQP